MSTPLSGKKRGGVGEKEKEADGTGVTGSVTNIVKSYQSVKIMIQRKKEKHLN